MGSVFNANEVFEIAKQIERNGAAFYRKAAEGNKEGAAFLSGLAAQEDQHLAAFERMRIELSEREKESTAFDPDNEETMYLQAMASGYIFDLKANPAGTLSGKESLSAILTFAIGMEKDSIVFYSAIRTAVPPKLGGKKIDQIIEEELRHLKVLSDRLAELKK